MTVRWVYRVVIDHKPDTPPEDFVIDDREWAGDLDHQWRYYGTQQWARRRFLTVKGAAGIVIIHASNGVASHIERAPIGPWEEM